MFNVSVRDKGESLLAPEYAIDFLSDNSSQAGLPYLIHRTVVAKPFVFAHSEDSPDGWSPASKKEN